MNEKCKRLGKWVLQTYLFFWGLFVMSFTIDYQLCCAQEISKDDWSNHRQTKTQNDSDVVLANLIFDLQDILAAEYWGRNPFLPYANLQGGDKVELNSFQAGKNDRVFFLETIKWNRNGKNAIINHQKMALGDTLRDYTINYIGEKVVILKSKNDYVVLSLNE